MLKKDPETAERLFQKTLELEPPAAEKAWVYVYLGRLYETAGEQGDHQAAVKYYQSALAVEGATEKARETATQGMQGAFRIKAAQPQP
jgi:tetratricopeptide (TPR) repeat protein